MLVTAIVSSKLVFITLQVYNRIIYCTYDYKVELIYYNAIVWLTWDTAIFSSLLQEVTAPITLALCLAHRKTDLQISSSDNAKSSLLTSSTRASSSRCKNDSLFVTSSAFSSINNKQLFLTSLTTGHSVLMTQKS